MREKKSIITKTLKIQLKPQNPSVLGLQFGIYQLHIARFQLRIGKGKGTLDDISASPIIFFRDEGPERLNDSYGISHIANDSKSRRCF